MEWLKKILESTKKKDDGSIDIDDFMKQVNAEFPKNAVPKEQYNQKTEEVKTLNGQLKERDTQLNKLKEEFKDTEGLKEKVEKLEADNKTQKETYDKQLADIAFNNALEKSLGSYKIRDSKLVMALIDKDKLKVDGDTVIGLKEQIEPLQKSHEYLFEKDVPGTGSFITGGGDPTPGNSTNIASELGKQRAETLKAKSLTDFAK